LTSPMKKRKNRPLATHWEKRSPLPFGRRRRRKGEGKKKTSFLLPLRKKGGIEKKGRSIPSGAKKAEKRHGEYSGNSRFQGKKTDLVVRKESTSREGREKGRRRCGRTTGGEGLPHSIGREKGPSRYRRMRKGKKKGRRRALCGITT